VRGRESVRADLIRLVARRVASNLQVPCDTDEEIVNLVTRGRRRRAVRAARSRCEEDASRRSTVECRPRAVPEARRWRAVRVWPRSTVGRRLEGRNARIVPWWMSVTGPARRRCDYRRCVPRRSAPSRFAVLVWQRGRRDRPRTEALPALFWALGRVVSRWNRRENPPRGDVRGAFDEREESLRPRASLPVAFQGLFARHR
jgi:hypothetical protein